MVDITGVTLRTLGVAFKTNFQMGLGEVEPSWGRIATEVPSTTAFNEYGWLGEWPNLRKWLGDRVIKQLSGHSYRLFNEPFESTVAVKATDIEDDNLGIYAPRFKALGRAVAVFPDQLVWPMLPAGFEAACYDGQNFFDADHSVEIDGVEVSQSNVQAGGGNPWFLMDTTQPLKPLIYQTRKKPDLVAKEDAKSSDHVFMRNEYLYGTDLRCSAGFGFWQLAFGSKADLTEANFDEAYDAMTTRLGEEGRPLGIKPNLLVVGGTNRKKAQEIVANSRKADGTDNLNQGIVELFVSPWLT